MIQRINRLIIALALISLSLYLVLLNRDPLTIQIPAVGSITTMGGVILIGTFITGFLFAVLIALVFGVRAWWRERSLLNKERQRQTFYAGLLEARSALASFEWARARDKWQQIVRKDPTDVIARIELSRSLEGDGQLRESLAIVDEARASQPKNIEVLFRTVELQAKLGNKTAALDALRLILTERAIPRALHLARDIAAELGEYEQAIEFHDQVTRLGGDEQAIRHAACQLEAGKAKRDIRSDPGTLLEGLKVIAKRFPEDAPLLEEIGALALSLARTEEGTQYLTKAARIAGAARLWREAALGWLRIKAPDRALAAARAGCKETKGGERIEAELFLLKLLLNLNMSEEAKEIISALPAVAREQGVKLTIEQQNRLALLRGQCYHRLNDTRSMNSLWNELAEQQGLAEARKQTIDGAPHASHEAPSPTLSTP